MTLRRQLLLALSAVFLLIFAGLLYMSVHGTRQYLEEQLASHAQDAATSLSIPLAQSLAQNDPILVQLQVESMFDRGYFQRMVVLDPKGQVVVSKELPLKIDDVPLWFSRLFVLSAPGGEAFVTAGWKQLGKVVVVSQPAHAYQHLWSTALEVAGWIALGYAVALALTHGLLKIILNPLYAIERTAKAVQERRFEQITNKPRARELARVVRAMNDMSRRIAEILDTEMAKAEGFRKQVLQDEVTGLENRRSFDLRFSELLAAQDDLAHGAVVGVEIDGLKEFNTGASYQKGNSLLQLVANQGPVLLGGSVRIAARLGGAGFGFVLTDVSFEDAQAASHRLQDGLEQAFAQLEGGELLSFSVGAAHFNQGNARGQIMARLDMAIEAARQTGRNALHVMSEVSTEQDVLGSLGWRELIVSALDEGRWGLFGQRVVSLAGGALVHSEVMGRLVDKTGVMVPASRFIPMAARHKLMMAVDKAIFALARAHLKRTAGAVPLAINVSPQSLDGKVFVDWLHAQLTDMGTLAAKLSFEISCYGCSQNMEAATAFAAMVRLHGAKFGIDRLGLEPLSMTVLRQLPPDYVKLDSVLVHDAEGMQPAIEWVNSIASLARSLDVQVIAQGIESEGQVRWLQGTHDAGQGYYFGAPAALVDPV